MKRRIESFNLKLKKKGGKKLTEKKNKLWKKTHLHLFPTAMAAFIGIVFILFAIAYMSSDYTPVNLYPICK